MRDNLNRLLIRLGKYFTLAGTFIGIIAALYLFLTPKTYQATAKLIIEKRNWTSTNSVSSPYDPQFVASEFETLRSDAIFGKVITNLHLAEEWGQRSSPGRPLSPNDTMMQLRRKAGVQMFPSSSVINIEVTSEEPEETSRIANEIFLIYHDLRTTERKLAIQSKIKLLKEQWEQQSEKLMQAQEAAKNLRFDALMAQSTNPVAVMDANSIQHLQQKRISLEAEHVHKDNLLKYLKGLDREKLSQVLPIMTTNQLLNSVLNQVVEAEAHLNFSRTNSGPDSIETKQATNTIVELKKHAATLMDAALAQQEVEVSATKAELDKAVELLKRARPESKKAKLENPAYAQAIEEVQKLQLENDALKLQLDEASLDAVAPTTISAELLARAYTPAEPVTPNRPGALKTIWSGLGLTVLGLVFLLIGGDFLKPQTGPLKK